MKSLKYLFLRQKYQRKRIASSSQNEPRRIYDISNKIDENSSWMTKRLSMTLLSDSSDTEDDNEEEEMIAELNHLQKSVDLGGKTQNLMWFLEGALNWEIEIKSEFLQIFRKKTEYMIL